MESLLTRMPFLYPSTVRSFLSRLQWHLPSTQTRSVSRRIRRRKTPKDKLGEAPSERQRLYQTSLPPENDEGNCSSSYMFSRLLPSRTTRDNQETESPAKPPVPVPTAPTKDWELKFSNHKPRWARLEPKGNYAYRPIESFNIYYKTRNPTPHNLAVANAFFSAPDTAAKFLLGVERFRDVPTSSVPEVAFLGRSNVGKSSLLNCVFGETLAHTSARPGRTRTMNMYGLGGIEDGGSALKKAPTGHMQIKGRDALVVVDMPGYGYASRESWGSEILKYLTQRKQLKKAFLLIDAMHGLKQSDRQLLKLLNDSEVPYQVILSKVDRLYVPKSPPGPPLVCEGGTRVLRKSNGDLELLHKVMGKIRQEIDERYVDEMLACSSEVTIAGRYMGIDAVRFAIMQAAFGRDFIQEPPTLGNNRIHPNGATGRSGRSVYKRMGTVKQFIPSQKDTVLV